MGLFQSFKDYMWIAECDTWITDYAPQHVTAAKEFCAFYKEHLLMHRDMGKTPHEALISTCIFLVNAIAEGHGDKQPQLANHLTVAYQTAYGFLNRWPNVKLNNNYAVKMFRTMARVDNNIWQSPLAKQMSFELSVPANNI